MERKKKTASEKVNTAMKGATWEEAYQIGIDILGKYVAFQIYAHPDKEFDFGKLLEEICERGDKWVHKEGGAQVVAFARVNTDTKE